MQQVLVQKQKSIEARLQSKNREEFYEAVDELKQDPSVVKEIRKFIKATTKIYKLD